MGLEILMIDIKRLHELELKRRTKKFVVKYAVKVEVHC